MGFTKGMVVMATGTGKTYLAAFDSKDFKKVLFVAHREEILKQAALSFKDVSPHKTQGFFTGLEKEHDSDFVFASVQTLSKQEYLDPVYFAPNFFDYIIVDEFHHAAADSYRGI